MLVYQRVYLEHLGTSWNNQSRVVNESADKNRCRTQKLCRIRASSSFGATFKPEAQTDSKTRWNLTWRWQPQTGYQLAKNTSTAQHCSTNPNHPTHLVCVWLKVLIFILDVWFHLFLWETVFRGRLVEIWLAAIEIWVSSRVLWTFENIKESHEGKWPEPADFQFTSPFPRLDKDLLSPISHISSIYPHSIAIIVGQSSTDVPTLSQGAFGLPSAFAELSRLSPCRSHASEGQPWMRLNPVYHFFIE